MELLHTVLAGVVLLVMVKLVVMEDLVVAAVLVNERQIPVIHLMDILLVLLVLVAVEEADIKLQLRLLEQVVQAL